VAALVPIDDGDVDPLAVPPDATVGADVAHLEVIGMFERWQLGGHSPGGGFITCGGGAHVERLMWPLMVELFAEVVELWLLGVQIGAERSGGVGFQRDAGAVLRRSSPHGRAFGGARCWADGSALRGSAGRG